MDLAEGYDTDSYFQVQRRFVAVRGYPKKMRSDLGSQLVCANKEMKEIIKQVGLASQNPLVYDMN